MYNIKITNSDGKVELKLENYQEVIKALEIYKELIDNSVTTIERIK